MASVKVFSVFIGGLMLAGCASHPQYYYVPEQDPGRGLVPEVEADTRTEAVAPVEPVEQPYAYIDPVSAKPAKRSAGVEQLVALSEQQRNDEQYDAAAASLERALRISPTDPDLYYRLALVRMQQGRYDQADQLARRGLSVTQDAAQRARLQRLVEQAQSRMRG
ncbi:tetratricopeptide repeat protein [Aestuariirhabdus litorea]|uniref:Tetratricopeptide repeat protein n=1 Tax=Aestuariirhabdus litorea TaxID=2528527 RepID=A0A3P3VKD9_9GAMM|nr:tetratricopeptide repeat protein [Aestuariirhabdus litorea]RRJ82239.1 tetratricopeptide repeat protein [Aestuariirhabdus litorea]RWW92407.1 tetratricopeptide repeat protein [Endozoicomonadaceae bacterium GTF-13]